MWLLVARGVGFWFKWLWPRWLCFAFWRLSALKGRMNMAVPCSISLELLKVSTFHSQGILTEEQLFTPLVSPISIRNPPCLCPSFFISGELLSFKTPNFRDFYSIDQHYSSWGGSCSAFPCPSENSGGNAQLFTVYVKTKKKANTLAFCPQPEWAPSLIPENSIACWHDPSFLCPKGSSDHVVIPGILPTLLFGHLYGWNSLLIEKCRSKVVEVFCCFYYFAFVSRLPPLSCTQSNIFPGKLSIPSTFHSVVPFIYVVSEFLFI